MSATPYVNKYNFKVSPQSASAAIDLLRRYVEERAALLRPDAPKLLTEAPEAVRMMDALYKFKEELAELVKSPAEKAYDTLRFSIVPGLMDGEGLTHVGVEGVGRVNLQDDVQVKVISKDGLHEWLTENDLEDMIVESVNAQTLAAFVRRRTKAAQELPGEDIISVKPVVRAVITRG